MLNRNYIASGVKIAGLAFLICILLSTIPANSQHYTSKQFEDHLNVKRATHDSIFLIKTDYPATGIVAKLDVNDQFNGSFIIAKQDTFYLTPDEDNDRSEATLYSSLLTFSPPIQSFLFCPGRIRNAVTFYFINSQTEEQDVKTPATKKKSDGCSEPEMTDQTLWREGLPDPEYERIPNKVHSIIIHHSAGSNNDTDYLNVIRNIYIYHTEVRGWSDIGYNYLIVQDGTIFKGRDPGNLLQDEVLGAHFCGSNTGTLGICVVGDYTEVMPPDTALQSLIALVTWKMGKDSLDPLGIYSHPLNSNLPVIAGHRDGCATECPGDSLYSRLQWIRQQVLLAFNTCGYIVKPVLIQSIYNDEIRLLYIQDRIYISVQDSSIERVLLVNILGQQFDVDFSADSSNSISLSTQNIKPGTYVLLIKTNSTLTTHQIQVY